MSMHTLTRAPCVWLQTQNFPGEDREGTHREVTLKFWAFILENVLDIKFVVAEQLAHPYRIIGSQVQFRFFPSPAILVVLEFYKNKS